MSNETKCQPVIVEREPGLRETTLREIIKKRHAYPNEAVAMAAELIELRHRLNAGIQQDNGSGTTLFVPDYEKVKGRFDPLTPKGKQIMLDMASSLDMQFVWDDLYPGYDFWYHLANQIMRKDLQK